jgi:hypothetical protein
MSYRPGYFLPVLWCAMSVALCVGLTAAPAKPSAPAATPAVPAPVVIPKSVFDDPGLMPNLHDPFFPRTKRAPYVPIAPIHQTNNTPAPVHIDPYDGVLLKGIMGGSRKLVIVNNQTMAAGEAATVKRNEGPPVEIQVIEIKGTSAIIKAPGADPKEIFLRKSL